MLVALFWLGMAGTAYAYVLFPALVTLLARRRPRPGRTGAAAPVVTVIVPAFNEERSLATKLRNVLESDYPAEALDVLVVSDASTDGTDGIARSFERQGVRLIRQETRQGKTAGLNKAIDMARGEVVVFTDANAIYERSTIRSMVDAFDDPRMGLVSGYTRYTLGESGEVEEATNAYTSLERVIKRAESAWGCCVGADGAIFAMRRSLFRTLRNDDINDFVLPLSVIEQGYRCELAEDAYCSEQPGKNLESEFRRQSRITNRSIRAISRHGRLLNPFRYPAFAFCLFSHKVMRFLVPMFLVVSAVALALLALRGEYLGLALAAGAAALLAGVGRFAPSIADRLGPVGKVARMLAVFTSMNVAVLHGWTKFLSGNVEVTWQHDRAVGVR